MYHVQTWRFVMKRRKCLRLSPDEDATLKGLYRQHRVAVDRYQSRPELLTALTDEFNALTARDDSRAELLHYMRTKRKNRKWVTLDGNHRRLRTVPDNLLTPDEWSVVDEIYAELGIGSDNYAFNTDLLDAFLREFRNRTGRSIPRHQIAPALELRRKNRHLPCTQSGREDEDFGFTDLDAVGT